MKHLLCWSHTPFVCNLRRKHSSCHITGSVHITGSGSCCSSTRQTCYAPKDNTATAVSSYSTLVPLNFSYSYNDPCNQQHLTPTPLTPVALTQTPYPQVHLDHTLSRSLSGCIYYTQEHKQDFHLRRFLVLVSDTVSARARR
jgi:hypothetical protein